MSTKSPLTLEELAEFFQGEIKPEFEKINNRLDNLEAGQSKLENRLENVEAGQARVETRLRHVDDKVNSLQADISTSPSRAEFEEVKKQVRRLN